MDYSELAKGQHLTDAKDTIQLLMDEGYDFSEYSYDELLEAYHGLLLGVVLGKHPKPRQGLSMAVVENQGGPCHFR